MKPRDSMPATFVASPRKGSTSAAAISRNRPGSSKSRQTSAWPSTNSIRTSPLIAGALDDGDGGDRDPHALRADRELCPLPRGRIGWEPATPFLVHPGEVGLVEEDERRLDDVVDRGSRCLENGFDVPQALTRLLLDRLA